MGKKWARNLLRRRVFVILLLLLQIALMVGAVYNSGQTYRWVYNGLNMISILVVLHVISTGRRSTYKLLWAVTILSFPLFGGLLYVLIQLQDFTMSFKKRLQKATSHGDCYRKEKPELIKEFCREQGVYQKQSHYLSKTCLQLL